MIQGLADCTELVHYSLAIPLMGMPTKINKQQ